MGAAATLLKGALLIFCFLAWDFYIKEAYYELMGDESISSVALGYGLVFVAWFILSHAIIKSLDIDQEQEHASSPKPFGREE